MDEVSKEQNSRYCKPSPRSINPAGRSPSPPRKRMPAASRQRGVGWRGFPLRTIFGADSGFRRTISIHPRRAQRIDQVCGEVTVQSIGQGKNASRRGAGLQVTSSTAERSPFPSRGRTKTPLKLGRDCGYRALIDRESLAHFSGRLSLPLEGRPLTRS